VSTLALLGGKPAVRTAAPVWPAVTDADIDAAVRALRASRHDIANLTSVRGGGVVAQFEDDVCAFFDMAHCVTTNSGGTALQAALAALGIGAGDEVIVSPYTWGQAVSCVLGQCAVPVFADIDPVTLTMDPASVRRCVSPYTKAIVVPHVYGQPADMPALRAIADQHGLRIVEDCAQATGARIHGRRAGTFGDISCFSIGGLKHMTGGEGGFALTADRGLYERLLLASQHSIRAGAELTDEGLRESADTFINSYRIHPLAAAICGRQLRSLDEWNACRGEQARLLSAELVGCPGVTPVPERDGYEHVYFLYSPTYRGLDGVSRDRYATALRAERVPVMSGQVSVPAHLTPRFRDRHGFFGGGLPWSLARREVTYRAGDCPNAERHCAQRDLRVVLGTNLHRPAQEYVTQVAQAFWKLAEHHSDLTACSAVRPSA
jgi:perosamine synthetase